MLIAVCKFVAFGAGLKNCSERMLSQAHTKLQLKAFKIASLNTSQVIGQYHIRCVGGHDTTVLSPLNTFMIDGLKTNRLVDLNMTG